MVSHTPAPWTARMQTRKDGHALGWIIEWNNGRIGWASLAYADTNEEAPASDETTASNALVMAAAPDLLAALRLLLDHYTALVNCGDCGNWDPETEEPVIAARDAIAKAEGA